MVSRKQMAARLAAVFLAGIGLAMLVAPWGAPKTSTQARLDPPVRPDVQSPIPPTRVPPSYRHAEEDDEGDVMANPLIVTGAGSPAANGTYHWVVPPWPGDPGPVWYNGYAFFSQVAPNQWRLQGEGGEEYYEGSGSHPWTAYWIVAIDGEEPAPNVTQEGAIPGDYTNVAWSVWGGRAGYPLSRVKFHFSPQGLVDHFSPIRAWARMGVMPNRQHDTNHRPHPDVGRRPSGITFRHPLAIRIFNKGNAYVLVGPRSGFRERENESFLVPEHPFTLAVAMAAKSPSPSGTKIIGMDDMGGNRQANYWFGWGSDNSLVFRVTDKDGNTAEVVDTSPDSLSRNRDPMGYLCQFDPETATVSMSNSGTIIGAQAIAGFSGFNVAGQKFSLGAHPDDGDPGAGLDMELYNTAMIIGPYDPITATRYLKTGALKYAPDPRIMAVAAMTLSGPGFRPAYAIHSNQILGD